MTKGRMIGMVILFPIPIIVFGILFLWTILDWLFGPKTFVEAWRYNVSAIME